MPVMNGMVATRQARAEGLETPVVAVTAHSGAGVMPELTEAGFNGLITKPFDVQAVVTRGEMWLACGDETRHLKAGDTFTLARDIPHSEKYGPQGATFWVARRN